MLEKPGNSIRSPIIREWRIVTPDLPLGVMRAWVTEAATQSGIREIRGVLRNGQVAEHWTEDVAVAVSVTESKILAICEKDGYFYLLEQLRRT